MTAQWPTNLAVAFSCEIKRYRQLRKLTATEMAKRLTDFGFPYTRAQVVNFERSNNRRSTVTLGEIIAFGHVLGVPPALLAIPIAQEPELEIVPGGKVATWSAYRWFIGDGALDGSPMGPNDYAECLDAHRRLSSATSRLAETGDDVYRELVIAISNEMRARGWTVPEASSG